MYYYLCQGGYVFVGVSLLVRRLCNNYSTDFHTIRWKGGTWTMEVTPEILVEIRTTLP